MKKLFLLSFILLIVNVLTVVANPVDQQTAKEIGARYLNASDNMKANVGEMSLAKTYFMDNGEVALYVFNASKGFVIVSAQDVAIPILGYSDEGQFDANDIPEAMEWWLKDYAGQINYGLKERAYDIEKTSFQWEMVKKTGRMTDDREDPEEIVSPLLVDPMYGNIEWNQGKYYNDSCPEAKDAAYLGYHTYAGCVTCPMSQIMRKWKWPETGEGDHTSTGKPDTLYVNFIKTNYDWANMPVALTDVHGVLLEGITETQRRAVNQLIYHAGVAVNMRYNASGSSAYSEDVATALLNFFKYSDELSFEKLVYNADQIALWKVKLRSSLNHGYPMYYSGATTTVGHAFVCDGYRSDNYFHINWGYSGNMNSYFAIGALNYNPSSQYNAANDAIFNIHPRGTTTTFVITAASINDEYGTVEKTGTGGAIESSYLTEGFYTLNVNGGWDAGKDNETAIKPNEGILVQATSLANDQTLTVTNVTTGYVEPGSGDGELQIFDVTGRMVSTQHISGVKTVEKPSQGVYIFRLVGTDVKTQKIIVK